MQAEEYIRKLQAVRDELPMILKADVRETKSSDGNGARSSEVIRFCRAKVNGADMIRFLH